MSIEEKGFSMREEFSKELLQAIPKRLRDEASRYLAEFRQLCKRRYYTYAKIRNQIIRLKGIRKDLRKETAALELQNRKLDRHLRNKQAILNRIGSLELTEEFLDRRDYRIRKKEQRIMENEKKVGEKQAELTKKRDRIVDLRKSQNTSYYKPTLTEERLFIKERPIILKAIQQYGMLTRVLKHCKDIKTPYETIQFYRRKYPEFASDIHMAHDMWKDALDAEVIDRALEGTDRPVFQRGEYLGDYKFKSDKLLELAVKAHVPEKYDRGKLDRVEGGQAPINFNVINFNNVDEEQEGGVRDIGVVKNISKDGIIERVTKDKKLLDNPCSIEPDENYEDEEEDNNVVDI